MPSISRLPFNFDAWHPAAQIISFFFVVAILIAAVSVNRAEHPSTTNNDIAEKKSIDDPYQQNLWVARCKKAVSAKMKDPSSTIFRNTVFHAFQGSIPVTCGEINAKNSFGAYGGYQRFVSAGSPKLSYLEKEISDFPETWNKLCRK